MGGTEEKRLPKIQEAIVVEGRYDKSALSQVVDAPILTLEGFSVFHNREKLRYLRRLAEERGLILFTDSDGAGFVLRRYLKGALPPDRVKHAYIPEIPGKERRKRIPGKAGLLGVEGMRPALLLDALRHAGATFLTGPEGSGEQGAPSAECSLAPTGEGNSSPAPTGEEKPCLAQRGEGNSSPAPTREEQSHSTPITKTDLYVWGLSGGADSRARRQTLCRQLSLPEALGANALLEALNLLHSREEVETILEKDCFKNTRTGGIT